MANNRAFIFQPTNLAAQLSSLTGRPALFKSVPKAAKDGKPLMYVKD